MQVTKSAITKIQDINKNIDDFKTVQGERKREDDRKF